MGKEEETGRPVADTSAVDKLLAEIPSEGEATEAGLQDGPAASPAEKPKTEAAPEVVKEKAEEGNEPKATEDKLPFHRHPRWKALREDNKRKDAALEELRKTVEDMKTKTVKTQESQEIPQEFKELFGEDQGHWQKFQKLTTSQAEAIVNARFKQMEETQAKTQQESARWTQWVDEQMVALSEETGLSLEDEESSERNEILKIALEYSPTDKHGNIDLHKAYELWKTLKNAQPKSDEKKKVAALTVEEKADGIPKEKVIGMHELKGKNWRDFMPN